MRFLSLSDHRGASNRFCVQRLAKLLKVTKIFVSGDNLLKSCHTLPHLPETVDMNKCDCVNPFLVAALTASNHRVNLLLSNAKVLYLHNMVWKAASVTRMSRSVTFHREKSLREVRTHGQMSSYQGIWDVYYMQNRSELMGSGYAVV